MKSERPQIHESNLLADKVENFLVKVRDRLPAIAVTLIALIVGLISWGVYKSYTNAQSATAWSALYFSDTDTDDLNSIGQDFGNSNAGRWAYQAEGDAHLAKAGENVFVNRDIADQHYQKAVTAYEAITSKSNSQPENAFITARAYYGLAQAYEGLGKRDEAIKAYRKVTEQRDQSAGLLAVATSRADWLESKEGEDFFAWFAKNRQAAPTIVPSGSAPELPSGPTIDFSETPNASQPAESQPADTTSAPAENDGNPSENSTSGPDKANTEAASPEKSEETSQSK